MSILRSNGPLLIYQQISRKLDEYAAEIQKAHLTWEEQTPRQLAETVAGWLRSNKLVGIQPGEEYHRLAHNFISKALFGEKHDSLPIIGVIIFCCVMKRLGVRAFPLGLPFHVYAIVQPKTGQDVDGRALGSCESTAEPIYMDPFRGSEPISVSTLREQCIALGLPPAEVENLPLDPTPLHKIVARCSMNITGSLRATQHNPADLWSDLDATAAHYAALWAFQVAPGRGQAQRPDYLVDVYTQYYPYDGILVEKYCCRLSAVILPDRLASDIRTQTGSPTITVKRRKPTDEERRRALEEAHGAGMTNPGGRLSIMIANPKHFVGQVFRHKRYNYTAVITGWDPWCIAATSWISRMGIDRMEGGRGQPFYHAL